MINYISTRGPGAPQSFTDVLLSGLAPDGGLYIPAHWPQLDIQKGSYAEIAKTVIAPFTESTINNDILQDLLQDTYNSRVFDHPDIAPIKQITDNIWLLELFHGPTLSFKDYALQLLGRLFDHVLEQKGKRITIVGATSGDTGSAAIEACKTCKNIDIFILHPKGRTSAIQRKQMTTVDTDNVHNIALEGDFDDCQAAVKALFADTALRKELNLSAVNSINWARIMAQMVYYVATRSKFTQDVSFVVPTGNFGNIYAAWASRHMELPISELIVASNRNDILTRFFESGQMKREAVIPSLSPSMDIQVSSNFERFLCDLLERDHDRLIQLMEDFYKTGTFNIDPTIINKARGEFSAYRCSDEQTLATMKACFEQTGEQIDPHTATAFYAAQQHHQDQPTPMVIVSTAHPAKFPEAVIKATGKAPEMPEKLASLMDKTERYEVLPNDINAVKAFIRARTPQ